MSIVLQGSTSGSITLQEPAVAGSTVLDLPATSGTVALTSQLPTAPSAVGQIPFSTDGSTYTPTAKIVRATVVNASGTSVDFTGIPSWVKRVTVVYSGLSTTGISSLLVQIGDSGGIETTGYLSTALTTSAGGSASVSSTSGFAIFQDNASYTTQGIATIINISGNNWVFAQTGRLIPANTTNSSGDKTLSDVLDRVRITTVNGTDTFDAGTINILYE